MDRTRATKRPIRCCWGFDHLRLRPVRKKAFNGAAHGGDVSRKAHEQLAVSSVSSPAFFILPSF